MSRIFTPRDYQQTAIRFLVEHPRANLFASPGLGKTCSTLSALEAACLLRDSYPILVVAPHRVANSVWTRETSKWVHLNHLRVSKVLGTAAERIAALRAKADIYTINYENLGWLEEQLGGKMPFKTVVADECFPSGTQVSTPCGSADIAAIKIGDEVATPAGVHRVSYVFKSTKHHLVRLRFSNGQETIVTANHPYFTDAGWLPAASLEGRQVAGPTAMRALLKSFLEERGYSSAPSDAAAEHVLLQELYVKAQLGNQARDASHSSGEHAASQQARVEQRPGVAGGSSRPHERGQQSSWQQTAVSGRQWPDSAVREEGQRMPAGELAMGLDCTDGAERARLSVTLQTGLRESSREALSGGGRVFAPDDSRQAARRQEDGAAGVLRVESVENIECGSGTAVFNLEIEGCPMFFADGVLVHNCTRLKNHRCSVQISKLGKRSFRRAGAKNASALARMSFHYENHFGLTGTPTPNGLKDLWGQQFFVDHGEQLGRSYTAFTNRWFRIRPGSSREAAVFEPLAHAEGEITERLKATTLSLDAYDWFDVERPREVDIEIELTDRLMRDYRTLHNDAVLQLSEDTTVTAVNAAVITAKCLQFATGILHDSESVAHPIHDLKLDALESLVESLCGAPLLVAYHWQASRDAILRRFKGKAEVLPKGAKQEEVERRWNKGEIPMLLVHPQSCAHGIDLQHGGHNLCIFSPQWDLELYQQVIERIGPVRQAQAGYDRLVNVYRLITKGTFDEVVIKRMDTKCTVQQAVMQAVRA